MSAYAMELARSRMRVGIASVASALWLVAAACSNSSSSTGPNTGSLTVTITAPSGVTPSVTVSGPAGYHQDLTATQTLSGLAAGSYTVTATSVTVANPIVATVYAGASTGSPATVNAGATAAASVSYAARAGSGALWVTNFIGSTILSYTAAQLAASTGAAPATALRTDTGTTSNAGVAIDGSGNLWMAQAAINTVVEYTASQLAASGSPTPTVTLSATAGSLNGPVGLAFDGSGNLWVTNTTANTVVEFTSNQLATTGSPTPAITLSDNGAGSLNGPQGLAFDRNGNLWIGNLDNHTLVAFSPTQLASSGHPTPAVTLSDDGSGSIKTPAGLAFDGGGDLWVANYGANTVVELTSSQFGSSGNPTPAVTLTSTTGGLNRPAALAFDGGGDLWVANYGSNTVAEFTSSQLVASGAPVANVTVSGSSLTFPFAGLAFDPPAANLPIKP